MLKDQNQLAREDAVCDACNRNAVEVPWSSLEFRCTSGACNAYTTLPPAPPIFDRVDQPCRLQFKLHHELQDEYGNVTSSAVNTAAGQGGYFLQWRELEVGAAVGPEDGWTNGVKLVGAGKAVGKGKLQPPLRCQVRVRARIGPCTCSCGDAGFVECADAGNCKWTNWSQPSALATPIAANV